MIISKYFNTIVLQYHGFRIHRVVWRQSIFYHKFTFKIEVAYYTSQITKIKKNKTNAKSQLPWFDSSKVVAFSSMISFKTKPAACSKSAKKT
jgi:hypothetical protein